MSKRVKKSVSLPDDLVEKAQKRADAEGRKFSNWVTWVLTKEVNGELATEPSAMEEVK
jgi:hypothetical protein